MENNPIRQTGQTFDLAVSSTSARINVGVCDAVLVYCPSVASAPIWVAIGDSTITATVPVSGTPGDATPVAPGTELLLATGLNRTWVAAVAGSGTADLIITPVMGTQH